MTPTRRRWRRLRRWLWTAFAGLLVSAAGLMALGRLLVPWLVDSPQTVATWLGERIGRNVELESVQAHWDGPGPVLDLGGLRISGQAGEPAAITLGRVRVQVDVYALLIPGRHFIRDFLLVDARVGLVREIDGRILLEGFGRSEPPPELKTWLGRVGHLGLSGGQLALVDRASERSFVLDQVELRLSQQGERLSLGLERLSEDGSGRLRLVFEHQGPMQWPAREAELYIEAEHFPAADLSPLAQAFGVSVRSGVLDGRQWLSWRNSELSSMQGDWRVEALVAAAPSFEWLDAGVVEPYLHLPQGRLVVNGESGPDGFQVDLRAGPGVDPDQLATELSARFGGDHGLALAAANLPIELAAAAAQLLDAVPAKLRAYIYSAQPRGQVRSMHARRSAGHWQAHASLDDLQLRAPAPRWPQFSGLNLDIAADGDAVVLQVNGDAVEFAVPGVLRAPVALSRLDLLLGVSHPETGWTISVPSAHLEGAGFLADLGLQVDLNADTGPLMQGVVRVPQADLEAAKAFWVINKMPPRVVAWLDRALGVGRVVDGAAVFRGNLRDWPFAANQGRFEARLALADAELDYHDDWPRARELNADLAFINTSIAVEQVRADLSGNRVVAGRGGIAHLKDPVLTLDLAGQGDAATWLQFLKDSPLRRSYADVLFGMSMTGPAEVEAKLTIPLRKNLGKPSVTGQALLDGVAFRDTKWNLKFDEVRGRADFSDAGFAADRLTLDMDGRPGELGIAVGTFSSDPGLQVEATLSGSLSAQTLFGQYDALSGILEQVKGNADWSVALKAHRAEKGADRGRTELSYESSLAGITVSFPPPLGKLAEQVRPLRLQVELPASETQAPSLRLDIGQDARLFAVVGTPDSDFRGQMQLGAEQAQDLPARGLRVSGAADHVDLPGWAGWVVATTSASAEESVLSDVDVQMAGQQRLRLDRSDGPWVLKLDGPTAQGFVRFEAAGDRPAAVIAQFERLHLPEPGDGDVDLMLTPSMIPTLHLWVKDLRVGAAQLGEARLEAFASDSGLRVDLLEARSPDLEIHANGDWHVTPGGGESRFKIRMLSEDLGRMLRGLGFAGVIAGGQTLAKIDARWRGAPYAFALERLTGSIDVTVGQGRFLDVDPGAGRIFGLLSLRELPRRLTLDFRDLFQTGMSFDRIEGRFQLADGNAWTENLTVRGPAADLLIIGRTGLSSRDYDQQVMVAPHVSGVLPVLGGLAAGPVGAAAGFLAQGMVAQGNDIEKSSRVHYSIAGSWEKPVVARLTPVRPDAPPRRRPDPVEGGSG